MHAFYIKVGIKIKGRTKVKITVLSNVCLYNNNNAEQIVSIGRTQNRSQWHWDAWRFYWCCFFHGLLVLSPSQFGTFITLPFLSLELIRQILWSLYSENCLLPSTQLLVEWRKTGLGIQIRSARTLSLCFSESYNLIQLSFDI